MTTRSEELAQRFEKANDELIALVERLDEQQWQARCPAEGWTTGVAAAHVGEDHKLLAGFVEMIANGQSLPDMNREGLDQFNAEQAARNAAIPKEQAIQLLRSNGSSAANMIRGLTDAQVASAVLVPEYHPIRLLEGLPERVTAQDLIEEVMIKHFAEHGTSIAAAVGLAAEVK